MILNWLKYKTFAVQIFLESNINHTERKSLVLKTMTAILLINETKTKTGNLSVLVGFKFIQFLTIIVQIRTDKNLFIYHILFSPNRALTQLISGKETPIIRNFL